MHVREAGLCGLAAGCSRAARAAVRGGPTWMDCCVKEVPKDPSEAPMWRLRLLMLLAVRVAKRADATAVRAARLRPAARRPCSDGERMDPCKASLDLLLFILAL
jgi:hypothetical protein